MLRRISTVSRVFQVFWVASLIVGGAIFIFSAVSSAANAKIAGDGLFHIDQAYRDGRLTYTQAMNYRVDAIFHPEDLPPEYRPTRPIKSATAILREALSHRSQLLEKNRNLLLRPTDTGDSSAYGRGVRVCSYVSSGGHFRLHYTTQGADAVSTADANQNNVPDYVEAYATYLEDAWTREVVERGFDAAPPDGVLGGDCLLDVYIMDMNAYGVTVWENDPSDVYLIVENDYSGFPGNLNDDCPNTTADCQRGAMKVTAAHEFFHTIQWQISQDVNSNGWWMEASATWMEDAVFPEVKDYLNYLDTWFAYPDLPLDTFDGAFEYGTVIWAKHLSEKYGEGIVREIWLAVDDAVPMNALGSVEQVLADHGSSLAGELGEFRAKNAAVRYWDTPYVDGQYYFGPDMVVYGDTPLTEPFTNPLNGDCTFDITGTGPCILSPLSSFYYLFLPPSSGTFTVAYDGDTDPTRSAASILVLGTTQAPGTLPASSDYYIISELSLDASQQGQITVGLLDPDTSVGPQAAFKRVMVVVVNADDTQASSGFLSVSFAPGGGTPSVSSLSVSPQDVSIDSRGRLQHAVLMQNGSSAQVMAPGLSWSSDAPLVGDVDGNGLAAMLAAGSTQITASLGTPTSQSTLTGVAATSPGSGSLRTCNQTQVSCITMPGGGKSDKRCFIATAAFGTPLHPYVRILREFRDLYLLPSSVGQAFVAFYYEHSPALAERIARHDSLKVLVATLLIPWVAFAAFMVKVSLLEKMGLLLVVLWGLTKRRGSLHAYHHD